MKRILVRIFSFIISITIVVVLISFVDLRNMIDALLDVNVLFYSLALFFYIASYFSRTWRLVVMFGSGSFSRFFMIICGSMFINHLLPFRSGELSLPYLLKKTSYVPYSEGLSALFLFRLLDILALLITFFFLAGFMGMVVHKGIFGLLVIFAILIVFVIYHLKTFASSFINILKHIFPRKYVESLNRNQLNIEKALSVNNVTLLELFTLSLIDRVCNFVVTICLVIGMSYHIPVISLIFANIIASLTNILPINSIGSFGTLELGWTGALMMLNIPKESAISSGFNFHILTLTFTISLGFIAFAIMALKYNINPFKSSGLGKQCE